MIKSTETSDQLPKGHSSNFSPRRRVEITATLELTDEEMARLADELDGRCPSVMMDRSEIYHVLRTALGHELRRVALGKKLLGVEVKVKVLCAAGDA